MFSILLVLFLIILGFGIGVEHNKKEMITSLVIFSIIIVTSFLMTFIFPVEGFISFKFPIFNQSIAYAIKFKYAYLFK